jgi:putative DNA primase/helicase
MKLTREQIRTYLEHRFAGQRLSDRDKLSVKCIVHDDASASMTLFQTGNGGANCHSCGFRGNLFQLEARVAGISIQEAETAIAAITGAQEEKRSDGGKTVAVYDYRNLAGDVEFQKRKILLPDGSKTFRVVRPKGHGWESGIGDAKRVLYNLPEVVTANVVVVCEGEKDCETIDALELGREIAELRVAATTNFDGAWQPEQSPKWSSGYDPYFAGKRVVVCVDNDDSGRAWAAHVAASVAPFASSVKLLSLPGLPEKGDVSDWMLTHTRDELQQQIKNAPRFNPVSVPKHREIFVSAGQFMATASERIDWMVDRVIQRGANGFLAAEPKGGKSWASADLLLSLATATPWLGFNVPSPVKCALVSREDNPSLTSWRLKSLMFGKTLNPSQFSMVDDNLYVNSRKQTGSLMLDVPEELEELISEIRSRQIEFCILDVFNVLHSADENDNTEMRGVLKHVNRIQEKTGCAVGIVHHFNKAYQGGSLANGLRGSSAISGFAEWMLGITIEDKETKIRKMEFELKASISPESFCWRINGEEDRPIARVERVPVLPKEAKTTVLQWAERG